MLSSEIHDMYNAYQRTDKGPSLDSIIGIAKTEMGLFQEIFIVVDALDEYEEGPGDDDTRCAFLTQLLTLSPKVNVLITSRPNEDIGHHFDPHDTLEIAPSADDLRLYIMGRLHHSRRLIQFAQRDPSLIEYVVENITRMSGKMLVSALVP